jgi:predicted enzyme related to lactoylglutathione lyase
MSFPVGLSHTGMGQHRSGRLVHLELHTGDRAAAREFYLRLCGWQADEVRTAHGSYLALELGGAAAGGGIVECPTARALWLPYVEVDQIREATDRAQVLGADVLLAPREGPMGWRSVVGTPAAGEVALWQTKR